MPALDAVIHSFEGQALTVVHSGPDTALRVQLRRGSILIKLPTELWLSKRNAPLDDNGVPWEKKTLAPVVDFEREITCRRMADRSQEMTARLQKAWADYSDGTLRSLLSISRETNIAEHTLSEFFTTEHAKSYTEQRQLRAAARANRKVEVRERDRIRRAHLLDRKERRAKLQKAFDEYEAGDASLEDLCIHFGLTRSAMMVTLTRIREQRRKQSVTPTEALA